MYFAFTSLSTVGFGDFHPVNSYERLICAIILVLGNAVFGYIIGIFKNMVELVDELKNDEYEEADQLSSFYSLLFKFNNNRKIKDSIK
jgi:voltage-gated potassium channel